MSDSTTPTFTYLGHATVRCDLPDGKVLLIDPWLEGNPACPEEARELERLDLVLITHGHFDHIDDAVAVCKRLLPDAVVANLEICHWLESQGVQNTSAMNLGGTQEALGVRITMVPALHTSGLNDNGLMISGGLACGFVVRLPGGFTFYHSGDTALFSDMQLIADLYRPELAFLPVGDHFTMDPLQAAWATRYLQVRRVVPIHWGTFPLLTGTPDRFSAELADLGIECEVIKLNPGESYSPDS